MSSMSGSTGVAGPTGKTGSKIPSGYKQNQVQKYGPELMQLFQEMMGQAGPDSFTARLAGGDESAFEEMERPAMRQFSAMQGNIGSRFSGMGMGAQKSSGFQNTMSSASSNFAQDLASKRTGLRQQAIKDLMSMSHQLFQDNPYETGLTKKEHKEPFWKQALGLISPAGGDIASGDTHNTQNFFKFLSSMQGG